MKIKLSYTLLVAVATEYYYTSAREIEES